MEIRSSASRFADSGWSPWKRLLTFQETIRPLAGRYLQLRITLRGALPDRRPYLTGVALRPEVNVAPAWKGKLTVLKQEIPRFVQSSVVFHYERPDQPKLARFRQAATLDAVVAGADTDFDKLVRLMDWVGSGTNIRGFRWAENAGAEKYPWDIERVSEITPEGKIVIKGHCMSYAIALVSAATALGYHLAHWAIEGFRDMGHEVVEIWTPSLRKWVYFDPSLTSYYYDPQTKEPLNVLELHNLVAKRFLRQGEDMNWWCQEQDDSAATKARVLQVGGQTGLACRVGPHRYGQPMPRDFDWGWNHGYLACGFVQLTPRNDFHAHPEKVAKDFGGPERFTADDYPFWVDEKTPPYKSEKGTANNWFMRHAISTGRRIK